MTTCSYHPDEEAAAKCVECKKAICGKCEIIIKGKSYCNPCVELMLRNEEPSKPTPPPAPSSAVVAPPHAHPTQKPATVTAASVEDAGNTSGQGKGAVIPSGVRGWNWGAFLLNWIWGMGNGVWIALLTFILGPIMSIILGIKGNEWAWRNKKWDSVEKFRKTQRAWSGAGIGLTCLSILMVVAVIVASSSQGTDWRARETIQEPLTMNAEEQLDEKTVNSFIQSDSLEILMSSTPYYLGSADSPQPGLSEYRKLKSMKVKEAISLTQNLFVTLQNLKNELEIYRLAYLNFIDIAMSEEPGLQQFAYDAAALEVKYLAREASLIAAIEGFDTVTISDEFVSSFFAYQKTAMVLDLARVLYEHLGYILSNSLQLSVVFENTGNPTIHKALADYESRLSEISQLNNSLTRVNKTSFLLSTVLKQIYTGDYYIGLGSLAYMENNIQQVKQAASTLQTSEYLDEEGIQFIHDYLDVFESVNTSLVEIMGNVDKKNLLADIRRTDGFALSTPVYADDQVNNYFSSAYDALNADANLATASNLGTGEDTSYLSWNGIKAAATVVTGPAGYVWEKVDKNILKPTQKVVGVGLDSISAVSKVPFDAACSLYYGNSGKDFADQVGNNFTRAGDNYINNMSGVDTLKLAEETFNTLEGAAESAAEATVGYPIEKIFGKGTYADYAPWLAGQLASAGVGCFTGFGKGIYQLANQKSTDAELAEGALNIILSFVGGSKTILKASAALKGTSSGAKILYEKGAIAAKKAWVNYEEKGASKRLSAFLKENGVSGGRFEELLRGANTEGTQVMREALEEGEKQTARKLDELYNEIKAGIKEIPGGGKEAFSDFVNERYAFILEEIKVAVKETIGKDRVEIIDNFLGSKADEFVVDWVSSLFGSEEVTQDNQVPSTSDTTSSTSTSTSTSTNTSTNTNTGINNNTITSNVAINGAIHIVSTPPGADIWLDNTRQSLQAPRTLHEIAPGYHKVALKIPGYQDLIRTVSVIAGQTAEISAKLEPLPSATGSLRIASDQSDATIVIDGTTQDVKTPASFKNVPAGSYKITVKKAGFEDYSERVNVEPLQERPVWAPLKPLQLVNNVKGSLIIGSVPSGADIYLNGQSLGYQTTHNFVNNIDAGTYTVGMKKAGYKDYSATAIVASGRLTELWAKLEALSKPVDSTPVESYHTHPEIEPNWHPAPDW